MSDRTWVIIVIVAIIGAVMYFIIGDWFNTYIQAADPLPAGPATKGASG